MKLTSLLLISGGITLLGCSSGGGGSSPVGGSPGNFPQPRPTEGSAVTTLELQPLPAERSPALRSGIYEAPSLWIRNGANGLPYSSQLIRVQVDAETKTYTLLMDIAGLPEETTFLGEEGDLSHVVQTTRFPDGTETVDESDWGFGEYSSAGYVLITDSRYETYLLQSVRVGLSHVTLGDWVRDEWQKQDRDYRYVSRPDEIYFIQGDRTSQDDIPLTGTATYQVNPENVALQATSGLSETTGQAFSLSQPITFTADFRLQRMEVMIDQPATSGYDDWGGEEIYSMGLQLSGNGPLDSGGDFAIPLAGTLLTADSLHTDWPVSGQLNGALYGPDAEQVGGIFYFTTSDSGAGIGGAFIGERE